MDFEHVWSHNNKILVELAVDPRLCEQCHLWGISWCRFIVFCSDPIGDYCTASRVTGHIRHNHTVSLTRLWGEETEEREDGKGRRKRRREKG